jgi:uncharacterized protein (DUF2267 family)
MKQCPGKCVVILVGVRAASYREATMSASGLDFFDKTVQNTTVWLQIMDDLGPDRRRAWHTRGVVLRTPRDRLSPELGGNLAAELPLLVLGAYYDQNRPSDHRSRGGSTEYFLVPAADGLKATRPANPRGATRAALMTLAHHVDLCQSANVRDALLQDVQKRWPGSVRA